MKITKKNPYPAFSMNIMDYEVNQDNKKSKRMSTVNSDHSALNDHAQLKALDFDRTIHKRTCTIKRSSTGNFTYCEEDETNNGFYVNELYMDLENFVPDYNDSDYKVAKEFPDSIAPMGIQAVNPMKKGKILGYFFWGEYIYDLKELQRRLDLPQPHCIIELDTKTKCWADYRWETPCLMRLINHSCWDLNCELVYLDPKTIGVRVKKNIKPGEWLHYDYNIVHYIPECKRKRYPCLCRPDCPNSI